MKTVGHRLQQVKKFLSPAVIAFGSHVTESTVQPKDNALTPTLK